MADPKQPYGWNGNEGEFISLKEAQNGTQEYRKSPAHAANGGSNGHYIGGKKLMRMLSEGKAVGVRAYYAKAQGDDPARHVKKGDFDIYFVPVDSAGSDILADEKGNSMLLNRSWPCPPFCGGGGPG